MNLVESTEATEPAVTSYEFATQAGVAAPSQSFQQLVQSDFVAWSRLWSDDTRRTRGLAWWKTCFRLWLNYCGLRATVLYRMSHALHRARMPLLPGMVARLNLTLHGLDIPASVSIGPGLYIPHPVGTVVTAKRIGANLTLISGITIGMRNERAFPRIGDNVFIGAGARILGGITIGDNVQIGANAVVLKDVPSGATAVGVPARIISDVSNKERDIVPTADEGQAGALATDQRES
jgi:serine O-acetyltransferase